MRRPKFQARVIEDGCGEVRRHLVDSRHFVTIAPDNAVWTGAGALDETAFPPANDAFVRIQPPFDADEWLVLAVRDHYVALGCFVRVHPKQRTSPIPQRDTKPVNISIRAAVMRLVQLSTNTDKAKLTELAEHHLAKVGL